MERRPENINAGSEGSNVQTPSASANTNKILIIVLSVVSVILLVVLTAFVISKNKLVEQLNIDKAELTEQIENLQSDYATLSSDYESINAQLDSSREQVNQLMERIRVTNATNRAKMRQYQKELGTLRSIMKSYIVQIDSLNTLNKKLKADARRARKEAAATRIENQELHKTVEDLTGKVETGSVIHARAIKAEAYNKNGKVVDKSTSVKDVLVTLSLMSNDLAAKGPLRVYVIIKGPDGNLLVNSESISTNEQVATSASREVDYTGSEVDMGIYMKNIEHYAKGQYEVTVLTDKYTLGTTQFMLR